VAPIPPRRQGSTLAAGPAAAGSSDAAGPVGEIEFIGQPPTTPEPEKIAAAHWPSMNGLRTDTLGSAPLSQDCEAAAAAADVMDSIANKLLQVQDFARIALRGELAGGEAPADDVVDAIADAIEAARRRSVADRH
jgi:hypothetical protein